MTKRYLIDYAGRGECEHPSGDFVHYADHESELSTLRARVEELERERDGYRKIVADVAASIALPDTIRVTGSVGDMIAYFKGLRDRADRLSEATRLAVEALRDAIDLLTSVGLSTNEHRTALDRLTNIMGESDAS